MTIGNLAIAMMVRHFIDHGHKAILLVGGATGMIGDPDGKSEERNLMTLEQVAHNKAAIAKQYKTVFAGQEFEIVDNYEWFKDISYLGFLRSVGKHVPLRQMLSRDFVQSRLGEDGAGISYAEFSYSLIQGYDFFYLHKTKGATLQVCGSDQWGNSIAGVELIRRMSGAEAHIWSAPLVVNKTTGVKFGKSEDGAIWLDPEKTSVYKFYQFWLNDDDDSVEDHLKIYTLLSRDEITEIMEKFNRNRGERLAQKRLAYEVTTLVHGKERAEAVARISEVLFGGRRYADLTAEDFKDLKRELLTFEFGGNDQLIPILIKGGMASSNSEARRFLESGAIYINGEQVHVDAHITSHQLLDGKHAIIRRGKNFNAILQIR